jgi:hypothetical protein
MGLAAAALLTLAWAFLAAAPAATTMVVRLDDYETSWPNHREVQALGASLLAGTEGVDVEIAPDLSTLVLITGDDDNATRRLTEAADKLLAMDIERQRGPLERDADEVQSRLDAVTSRLAAASQGSSRSVVAELADERAVLEREQLVIATALDGVRSLFVPVGTPSRRPSSPAMFTVVTSILLAGFSALTALRA